MRWANVWSSAVETYFCELQSFNGKYYIYILECSDGLLYTGFTNNISRRFQEQQEVKIKMPLPICEGL